MFGVALDLRVDDFKRVFLEPKSVLVGLASQLLLLPAITFVLIFLLKPAAPLALGLFLVAACPGGNTSNFVTLLAKGNAALSVSLTAVVTLLAVFFTPFNFSFWASMLPETNELLQTVSLSFLDMVKTITLLIIVPLFVGMTLTSFQPKFTSRIIQPVKILSIVIFIGFILVACMNNLDAFRNFFHLVVALVVLHNAIAFFAGWLLARISKLDWATQKAISIETGIQNSGLGLILIFNFFDGFGAMALVAACWGIWHLISGLILAFIWSKRW